MIRLTQPQRKNGNAYSPISFDEAFHLLAQQTSSAKDNQTAVLVSGDYCNEELYLIQRLTRTGLHTNAIYPFEYLLKGPSFLFDKNDIVPFAEITGTSQIFLIWDNQAQTPSAQATLKLLTSLDDIPQYRFNTEGNLHISNYAAFFRAINHYLIQNNIAKGIYVDGLGKNFETYKSQLLSEDYVMLLKLNKLSNKHILDFVTLLYRNMEEVFVVWEPLMDERAVAELENLCMLLDIQSKPNAGFICIKPSLNSQGLFDMGCFPSMGIGGVPLDEAMAQLMAQHYSLPVCHDNINVLNRITENSFSHCLVFNSTYQTLPSGVTNLAKNCSFSMMHTAYWNGEDVEFDLLLPAALPEEITGTFTDSARIPHQSVADTPSPIPHDNIAQFNILGQRLGLPALETPSDIFLEYVSFFKGGCHSQQRHFFK